MCSQTTSLQLPSYFRARERDRERERERDRERNRERERGRKELLNVKELSIFVLYFLIVTVIVFYDCGRAIDIRILINRHKC